MKTNKIDKKANTIAMKLGREATFPADRVIETSSEEHQTIFFRGFRRDETEISLIPPWPSGLCVITDQDFISYYKWSASINDDAIRYTIEAYHKISNKPLIFDFRTEEIIKTKSNSLYINGDTVTLLTPYAIALEYTGRKDEIAEHLKTYMDNAFVSYLSNFFTTIAWFNYLMEHPDHKQIKKTPSGVEMNGLRITSDEPTLKKIRSKQIHRVCTLWTVSGHIRHYKNGKTVYIKPYLKGKNRKAYQHEH